MSTGKRINEHIRNVEKNLPHTDEFAEAGGVVVPHRLRVAVRLQHGVRLDHLIFQRGLLLLTLLRLLP